MLPRAAFGSRLTAKAPAMTVELTAKAPAMTVDRGCCRASLVSKNCLCRLRARGRFGRVGLGEARLLRLA